MTIHGAAVRGRLLLAVCRQREVERFVANALIGSMRGPRNSRVFCRIDYHLATPATAALARNEHIYKDVKFSDHAPITVDYDFTL